MGFDEAVDRLLGELDRLSRSAVGESITLRMRSVVERLEMVKDSLVDVLRSARRVGEMMDRSGLRVFARSYAMCARMACEISDAVSTLRIRIVSRSATDGDFMEVLRRLESFASSRCLPLIESVIEEFRRAVTDLRWARYLYEDGKIDGALFLLKDLETRLANVLRMPRTIIEVGAQYRERARDLLRDISETVDEIDREINRW